MLNLNLFHLGDDQYYVGYYDPTVRWNGFACPFFTKEVAQDILNRAEESGDMEYTMDGDAFVIQYNNYPEGEAVERAYPQTLEVDDSDHPKKLYSIGGWSWVWSDVPHAVISLYVHDGMPDDDYTFEVSVLEGDGEFYAEDTAYSRVLTDHEYHKLLAVLMSLGAIMTKRTVAGRDSIEVYLFPVSEIEDIKGYLLP